MAPKHGIQHALTRRRPAVQNPAVAKQADRRQPRPRPAARAKPRFPVPYVHPAQADFAQPPPEPAGPEAPPAGLLALADMTPT
eukprot:5398228-Amphidinium_carterae.1